MNFVKFKDWIENNKWTSFVLIFLFAIGILFQITDFYNRGITILNGSTDFKIVSTEISRKHSVYRDIAKVNERMKSYFSPTQFNDENNYRQIVRDSTFFDNIGPSRTKEIPVLTTIITAFALDNEIDMEPSTKELFEKFETNEGNTELIEFIFSMIPQRRFIPDMDEMSPWPYVPFFPAENDATKTFHKVLDKVWFSDPTKTYRMRQKIVKPSIVEAYLEEYYAAFKLGFYPVFEVTLYNNGAKNILIDSVGAEVIDIAEYMGGAELIPTTDIINIPIEYKKGENWKILLEPIVLNSGDYLKILIRLEPQEKESSYLIRLKIKGDGVIKKSEVLAIDM